MLWLYLLATVNVLVIALRRVLRRLQPLSNELYSSKVAIEHVHSGVALVHSDGKVGFVNQSLCNSLALKAEEVVGHDWLLMFPQGERAGIREAYTQMLLVGISSLATEIELGDGSRTSVNTQLVLIHDHKMRVLGHHCMIEDASRERQLEQRVQELEAREKDLSVQLAKLHQELRGSEAATDKAVPPTAVKPSNGDRPSQDRAQAASGSGTRHPGPKLVKAS